MRDLYIEWEVYMKSSYKQFVNQCLYGLVLLTASAFSQADNISATQARQQKVDEYIAIFNGNNSKDQVKACNEFQWMGLSDTRLFDIIEAKLNSVHTTVEGQRPVNKASWYAKALGFSGQEKYLGTLKKIASSKETQRKLRKYADVAIVFNQEYSKFNPIIANTKNYKNDKTLLINNIANMIDSRESELQIIAAKRINYNEISDDYLYDKIDIKLQEYNSVGVEKVELDAFLWWVRIAAKSGQEKYTQRVKEISEKSTNKKIKRFAKKAFNKYVNNF